MIDNFSTSTLCVLFVLAAIAIGWAGTRLAGIANELADRTGLGEIISGALFVGASTSLPGLITSVNTAWEGYPGIAIGNALGGLTVQTAFLVIADMFYRKSNLEHAAASVTGLAQATVLVSMISIPLLAYARPDITFLHVHPASIGMFILYGLALYLLSNIRETPMWTPVETADTVHDADDVDDADDANDQKSVISGECEMTTFSQIADKQLWWKFAQCAAITAFAGFTVGESSIALVERTGISEGAFGTVFTAFANSLPELVTAIAAIRIGAVNLAVGDIIGGNAFEVLFIGAADFAYLDGSLYERFTSDNVFTAVAAILMTCVLLLGMLDRQRTGPAGIGWESLLVLLLYCASVAIMFLD